MTTRYQKQQKKYKEEEKRKKSGNSTIRLDKKSVVYIVLLFCAFAIFYFIMTEDIKGALIRQSPSWTKTMGQVQSIEVVTGIEQTRIGSQTTTKGHRIRYYFLTDGVVYKQEVFIGRGQGNAQRFINFVEPLDSIEVYYKKRNPRRSRINFDIIQ